MEELLRLQKEGKFRYLGVSNFDTELMEQISEIADIVSLQPQYNLLVREIEEEILPYTRENNIGILAYGSLGGGILTGKYTDQPPQLDSDDQRSEFYPFFEEPHWSRVKKLVELLKEIADDHNRPVAQLALNWVRQQSGVTTALVGAKNTQQAAENAAAVEWELSGEELARIEDFYQEKIKLDSM